MAGCALGRLWPEEGTQVQARVRLARLDRSIGQQRADLVVLEPANPLTLQPDIQRAQKRNRQLRRHGPKLAKL